MTPTVGQVIDEVFDQLFEPMANILLDVADSNDDDATDGAEGDGNSLWSNYEAFMECGEKPKLTRRLRDLRVATRPQALPRFTDNFGLVLAAILSRVQLLVMRFANPGIHRLTTREAQALNDAISDLGDMFYTLTSFGPNADGQEES